MVKEQLKDREHLRHQFFFFSFREGQIVVMSGLLRRVYCYILGSKRETVAIYPWLPERK